jgi:hypothetical protein
MSKREADTRREVQEENAGSVAWARSVGMSEVGRERVRERERETGRGRGGGLHHSEFPALNGAYRAHMRFKSKLVQD